MMIRILILLILLTGCTQPIQNNIGLSSVKSDEKIPVNNSTYFAEIDSNNEVIRVIVADKEFINSGAVGDPNNWIQTYKDGSKRKNYAGIGSKYNKDKDYFISKKPKDDAIFNEEDAKWIIIEPERIVNLTATSTK